MNQKFFELNEEKRLAIINAGLEVFSKNDYKHALTDDIAAKAGISKGLLFYYFHNKLELYQYLAQYSARLVMKLFEKMNIIDGKDFFDAINSCDSVFNLRYPYNGESSASLMQCMLIGKPCVVTDIGWFGELLDDIVYKVSCENSIDEIVECIEWLMSHDDDLQQMAMKGRQYVEMYCNENAVAESIAGVIQ